MSYFASCLLLITSPKLAVSCMQVAGLDSKKVFYWALAPMVAFYALFAAVLLPNADALQPVALATKYCEQLVRQDTAGCTVIRLGRVCLPE